MKRSVFAVLLFAVLFAAAAAPATAQQTTGNIVGRVADEQKGAHPRRDGHRPRGPTGFVRTDVTDGEGVYRLMAMPVGTYDVRAELPASPSSTARASSSTSAQTVTLDVLLKLAKVSETVTVTGETPLIETSSSASVGGVVEVGRIEKMPLNGRQFANLAATIPGVGLGFHSDPDQEHAVLAADQRRQRPQHQLPDRRRRQQRRHGRRPAAALPARGHPGVQLRHLALQGRVRPQQRRRDEHRDQERHQRPARQLLHDVPRQRDERTDPDGESTTSSTSRTTAATSTAARSAARSSRTGRTTSWPSSGRSRTHPVGEHRWACSRIWRRVPHAVSGRPCSRAR